MKQQTKRVPATLREFRRRLGFTQAEAADRLGITQAHWSRLEAGACGASPRLARQLADWSGMAFAGFLNLGDSDPGVNAGTQPKRQARNLNDLP